MPIRVVLFFIFTLALFITQNNAADGVTGCVDHSVKLYETQLDAQLTQKPVWIAPDYTTVLIKTLSNVWRSMDSGRNWEKLNLANETLVRGILASKDGSAILIVGTGTRIWSSTDGGKNFKLLSPPGFLRNIKMHPLHPTWVLATNWVSPPNLQTELYLTQDLGTTWTKIRTYVWDYDWHGIEDDENMIIVWERVAKTGIQTSPPWNNRIVKTTDFFRSQEQVIAEQIADYLALERHIFIAKTDVGGLQLLSSEDLGESFHEVRFPLELAEQTYTILDDSEGSTFINVRHSRTNWGNVYNSNSMDTDFTLSLERNPRSNRGDCDFRRMKGLDGIYIANTYDHLEDESGVDDYTLITYDMGGEWQRLPAPSNSNCSSSSDDCKLNLLGTTKAGSWYSKKEAVGLLIGTGNVGKYVVSKDIELNVYFSRDAGWTWEYVTQGRHTYEITNRGAIMVMSPVGRASNEMRYTLNEGKTWNVCNFSLTQMPFEITEIEADPQLKTPIFLVYGRRDDSGVIVCADFSQVHERECQGHDNPGAANSDYEYWEPSDQSGDECLLGRQVKYTRRKREAECVNPTTIDHDDAVFVKNCSCTMEDYECDFCYKRAQGSAFKCERDTEGLCATYDPTAPPKNCKGTYYETKGYRLIPGDSCDTTTGSNYLPVEKPCPLVPYQPPNPNPNPDHPDNGDRNNPDATVPPSVFSGSSMVIMAVLACSISLGCIFVGIWWMSGRNFTLREHLLKFVPENLLPEYRPPGIQYSTLDQAAPLSEDDLQEDAPELDLDNGDEAAEK